MTENVIKVGSKYTDWKKTKKTCKARNAALNDEE